MTRIKICGVTTVADAEALAELGVEAVGLNFYPKSPRYLNLDQARTLITALGPFTATVGVFVTGDVLREFPQISQLNLRAWQTYSDGPAVLGDHTPAHIPAYRVRNLADLESIQGDIRQRRPAAVLVDSYVVGEMGGTGHRAPWDLLRDFKPAVPLILAGGLTPENVAEAICVVRPWGVDVASGVESSPGHKDIGRVRAFIAAVRSVHG